MIQVYTGDGKGKTTAALGQALRAMGHGMKVFMIQFMKGRTYGELMTCESCLPDLTIVMSGRDEFVKKGEPEEIDLRLAREGLDLARKVVSEGEHQMLILDEINVAIDYGLLPLRGGAGSSAFLSARAGGGLYGQVCSVRAHGPRRSGERGTGGQAPLPAGGGDEEGHRVLSRTARPGGLPLDQRGDGWWGRRIGSRMNTAHPRNGMRPSPPSPARSWSRCTPRRM